MRAQDGGGGSSNGRGGREVIGIAVRTQQLPAPGEGNRPCWADILSWVMRLGHMACWWPSKRHPLLGNDGLWCAYVQMQGMLRFWRATRTR